MSDLHRTLLEPAGLRGEIAGHVRWLTDRNTLVEHLDTEALSEGEADQGVDRLNELDNRIITTPAANAYDVIAKLILVVQLRTEGHDISVENAAFLIGETREIFGIGRVSPSAAALMRGA
jgi:hypothetical protein